MKIAIIGLGLIGGSIGLALKSPAASRGIKIMGIPRREETIRAAIDRGAIDEGTTDHRQGTADADLIFVCTPINLILPVIREIAPVLKKGAVVTDVGSTKEEIVGRAEKLLPKGTYFVGGHPMAGKEEVKLESAEAGLFKDKVWVLAAGAKTNRQALQKVRDLVGLLGARVVEMDPKVHDLAVAGISHMPLAVAAALTNAIEETKRGQPEMKLCAASGFRDTTRVASGDPVLGVDMFTTNRKAVLKMLSAFKKALSRLEDLIEEKDVDEIGKELKKAKDFRDSIYGQSEH